MQRLFLVSLRRAFVELCSQLSNIKPSGALLSATTSLDEASSARPSSPARSFDQAAPGRPEARLAATPLVAARAESLPLPDLSLDPPPPPPAAGRDGGGGGAAASAGAVNVAQPRSIWGPLWHCSTSALV